MDADIDPASPVRMGARVGIRPVVPDDYEWLYKTSVLTPAGSHWRLHGETPTFDRFVNLLFENARCTYVAVARQDEQIMGMLQLWSFDPLHLTGHLTAFLHPDFAGRGWPFEAFLLFADHVFAHYRLRKLYIEALSSELAMFGSARGTILREEGVLRDHRYLGSRLVDYHILALYRDDLVGVLRDAMPRERSVLLSTLDDAPATHADAH